MTPSDLPLGELRPHAHQSELIRWRPDTLCDDGTIGDVRIAQGGYGSGKTTGGAMAALEMGFDGGGHDVLGMEPTTAQLHDVMVAAMDEVCEWAKIPCRLLKTDRRMRIGHPKYRQWDLLLRSAEMKRSAIEGVNVGDMWGDEWEQYPPDRLTAAFGRVRKGNRRIVLTSTAEGFNRNFELVLGDKADTSRTKVFVWGTHQNTSLSTRYLQELQARLGSDEEVQEKTLGIRTAKGGRVYSNFDRSIHAAGSCVPDGHGEIQVACDFNWSFMHWLICVVDRSAKRVHVLGEVIGKNTDTGTHAERTADRLAEMMGTSRTGLRGQRLKAFCDASGAARHATTPLTDVALLARAGFSPQHGVANPRVRDRVNTLQVMLRERRLTVDPKGAPHLLKCLEQQPRDDDGEPVKKDDLDHGPDALGYLCHWQMPVSLPRPESTQTHKQRMRRIMEKASRPTW